MSTTQSRAGTPSPQNWIIHETISRASSKDIPNVASLYEGAACVNGVPMSALLKCAGASRARARFKASAAGTLKLEFVRPPVDNFTVTPYAAGNPTPVAIVANTENLLSTPDVAGEASCLVTFTPTGAGVVTLFDWMAL